MLNLDKLSSKPLFLFLTMVAGNFIGNLLSCDIQRILNNSMFVKHALAIMLFFSCIAIVDDSSSKKKEKFSIINKLKDTLMYYLWFIILSRSDSRMSVVVILILFVSYILHISDDKNKTEENKNLIQLLNKGALFLSLISFFVYLGEKKFEYVEDFDYKLFFFGKVVCKNNTPKFAESKTIFENLVNSVA
jgi:hypothetical protein